MSRPHTSEDLSFVKHPTKPSTYVPGRKPVHGLFGLALVCLGIGILWWAALMITGLLPRGVRRVPVLIKGPAAVRDNADLMPYGGR